MQTIESTGKTLDEAIRSGLAALGVEREAVTVEIIQNPKSGFFGLGGTLARVKLTLAASEAKSHTPPRQHQPQAQAQNQVQHQPHQPQKSFQKPQKPRTEPRHDTPRPPRQPRPSTPATPENLKKAEDFIGGLLTHLNMGITATTSLENGTVQIILEGDNIGNLIGRRGDTLDAIQHLAAHVVNTGNDEFSIKVHVDAADYRRKRQEALEQLAQRMAANAIKYRSNMTLEPMNAYERHIIHMALQDMPGISTFSTGSEPQRRVVIACQRPGGRTNGGSRPPARRDNAPRSGGDFQGHRSNPRPPQQSRDFKPRTQSEAPSAPATAPVAAPQPRTLPVKEFGTKKTSEQE